MMEKEAITNLVGDDLDARNRNWDKIDSKHIEVDDHLADMVTKRNTLTTSMSPNTTNQISRSGNVVTVGFYSSGTLSGSLIATIPEGFRPNEDEKVFMSLEVNGIIVNYPAVITPLGAILQQYTQSNVSKILVFGTYII